MTKLNYLKDRIPVTQKDDNPNEWPRDTSCIAGGSISNETRSQWQLQRLHAEALLWRHLEFSGHKYCESDIWSWVGALYNKSPSAMFGGYWDCDNGDSIVLICHMILKEHITKGPFGLTGRNPSR